MIAAIAVVRLDPLGCRRGRMLRLLRLPIASSAADRAQPRHALDLPGQQLHLLLGSGTRASICAR